jgi:multiple sugar transport system permease protein
MKRSPLHQALVYVLLLAGTVLFSFPFIWMFTSSMKVDRELFTEDLRILPNTPRPVRVSPYIDPTFYLTLPDNPAKQSALLPDIEKLARASGHELPEGIDPDVAYPQIARGLYRKLKDEIPVNLWRGQKPQDPNETRSEAEQERDFETKQIPKAVYIEDPQLALDNIRKEAASRINAQKVKEVTDQIYRFLAVGGVRVRGAGIKVYPLGAGQPVSKLWTLSTQAKVTLEDFTENNKSAARIKYDFENGNTITLTGEFDLPAELPAADVRRFQIDIKPDDSWHDFNLVVEHSGKKFLSSRSSNLGNFDWFTQSWQPASEDDNSTKLRTWVVLAEKGSSDFTAPGKVRLTLTFARVSQPTAWANKVKQNYIRTAEQIPFWRYVRVSLFLVLANIVLTVLSSSLVAYAFARITWPGRDICFLLMLATMMIPPQVTMIPHFLIWSHAGAYDTLTPLWLGSAFGSAFFVFMLRQFMMGIPRDLEDAARIDGCGFLRIYWHVILPLITPSLAAIAVMTFMGTWNNFMDPLIYIADQRLYPLAFGLYAFNIQVASNPTLSMAGSVLMTIPVIVLFFTLQRYFIQGITLTGMKG